MKLHFIHESIASPIGHALLYPCDLNVIDKDINAYALERACVINSYIFVNEALFCPMFMDGIFTLLK